MNAIVMLIRSIASFFSIIAGLGAQSLTTVSFTESTDSFPNPERGFYGHTQVSSTGYSLLSNNQLSNYQDDNITLILRVFYLENFRESPISQAYLNNMEADFNAIRQASTGNSGNAENNVGMKVIVRFAYSNSFVNGFGNTPYNDATPEQVLEHISQLGPILTKHSDVISCIQSGFVGTWGEWFYTDHFTTSENLDNPSTADWNNRRAVIEALLDAVPEDLMVQLRTPRIKYNIAGTQTALPETIAFDGSSRSRMAHHNDCFLASSSDFGTYGSVTSEKNYLAAETKYLVMGGETCTVNPPRSSCDTAKEELERFHWSYLNSNYNGDVLNAWKADGCYDEVERRLGYRLAMKEATYSSSVNKGDPFTFNCRINNTGYASFYRARKVKLVLRKQGSGETYVLPVNEDPRHWYPEDSPHEITLSAGIGENVPVGTYDLLFHMPDANENLSKIPAYAVKLAHDSMWETNTGYNDLGISVTINASDGDGSFQGNSYFTDSGTSHNYEEFFGELNPIADSNGNGFSDLLDYAQGMNTSSANPTSTQPTIDAENATFYERANMQDVVVVYEASEDLSDWKAIDEFPEVTQETTLDGDKIEVDFRLPNTSSNLGVLFIRQRVALNE